MARIALTGGLAAGKSTVARLLAVYGWTVLDYDLLAREVVAPGTPGLGAVVACFGPGVVADDGEVDRGALARVVCSDGEARVRLEGILHPLIRALAAEREEAAVRGGAEVVVHEIPLLDRADGFDLVVTVEAPVEVRVARAVADRGMTPEEAEARIAAQPPPADREAMADLVLDGRRPPEELAAAAVAAVSTLE
jgi:dephospho-CoA kinase